MNRGDVVKCIVPPSHIRSNLSRELVFKAGRNYKVIAGYGDGDNSRSDGCVGAAIIDRKTMCITDDFGIVRRVVFNEVNFEIVSRGPEVKDRVAVTHIVKGRKRGDIVVAAMGEFSAADAGATGIK